ncbi:MAG: DUF6763 family protein [Pseudomonadota bacterium]
MATEADPITGNWYKHLDKGYEFRVVSVDEDEGIVEIQHFDGDIEALDMDSWYETDVEPIEPPEDWTGPMDDIERDDLGYTETDMEKEDWTESLDELSAREEREEARRWIEEEE